MKTILLFFLLAPALLAGPIILVANKKGNSFEAELISATATTATVRRSSDKKIFDIKLSTLSADCVKTVEKHRPNLKPPHPAYKAVVSIGSRRRQSKSYSRETQDISASAKITNKDRSLPSPEVSGRIVFIGQNQQDRNLYQVLATRDFKVAPEAGATVELKCRPFENIYYDDDYTFSESKFAQHKYDGYLLVLYSEDNTVVHHHTTNSRYKKALESDVGILDSFRTIKALARLGKNLQPLKDGQQGGNDVIEVGN